MITPYGVVDFFPINRGKKRKFDFYRVVQFNYYDRRDALFQRNRTKTVFHYITLDWFFIGFLYYDYRTKAVSRSPVYEAPRACSYIYVLFQHPTPLSNRENVRVLSPYIFYSTPFSPISHDRKRF